MLKRKHEVVMLPTNKASDKGIILITNSGRLAQADRALDGNKIFEVDNYGKKYDKIPQHLYFLSDEEIKEGDWAISRKGEIFRATEQNNNPIYGDKKVIGATDKSLTTREVCTGRGTGVPAKDITKISTGIGLIRESFVKIFIAAHNAGNPIKWVDLEYEDVGEEDWMGDNYNGEPFWNERLRLKLRGDNTVIVHAIKNSFTREEVETISLEAFKAGKKYLATEGKIYQQSDNFKEWFGKNY